MPWQKAMIPWELISNRDIGLLFYCECATGVGMYAVLYFCNIYFIAVRGYDSDEAGVQLLYFVPGLGGSLIGFLSILKGLLTFLQLAYTFVPSCVTAGLA
jgi:hypothetical protein